MNTLWSDHVQGVQTLYLSRKLRFDDQFFAQYQKVFNLDQTAELRILEIGCGPGALAEALHRWYPRAHITGVDRDSNFVSFAAENIPGVTFCEGDATRLPFEDGSFDVTISNTVSEHIEPEAFWKDNAKMQEVVVRQTGQSTNLMRFAGGSSNTMAVWQSPDIMENLVNQAAGKGFQYFDWNVSSGDGAAEGDSAMVISKITDQIRNFDESVVLCHDTKEYTVNAMEYLIPWLLDNGYTLRPLTVDSEPAHHIDPD